MGLYDRITIVVSNTAHYNGENCFTANSLMDAIRLAGNKDIYISGGARLYEEALPLVEKMYITEIDCDIKGDTCFPPFESEQFVKEINERFEGEIPYAYVTYTRKRGNMEWISK
ncbi:MAG: dihydrofolate reductase [Lachnospiraceae bacterium]|nr:dihydrofolate reductase [Lachnospiraceae bacterium]